MSPEYLAALDVHTVSFNRFQIARDAFRAGKLNDKEFFAHQAAYREANIIFDAAFEAERNREIEKILKESIDTQFSLI